MSSYLFKLIIIIPNHKYEFKYEILALQIFPQIGGLIYELVSVKIILSINHQNNNGAVAMRKICVQREQKQQLYQFKNDNVRA